MALGRRPRTSRTVSPCPAPRLYNLPVPYTLSSPPSLPVWQRLAAWLGFLAVLSALLAPVSMLAQDVRTGKLGGLCSVSAVSASSTDAGGDGLPQAGMRCDLCGSVGLALPPLPASAPACLVGHEVAPVFAPSKAGAAILGLRYSRGPPAL